MHDNQNPYGDALSVLINILPGVAENKDAALNRAVASVAVETVVAVGDPPVNPAFDRLTVHVASPVPR
jgi:hypothetical protein